MAASSCKRAKIKVGISVNVSTGENRVGGWCIVRLSRVHVQRRRWKWRCRNNQQRLLTATKERKSCSWLAARLSHCSSNEYEPRFSFGLNWFNDLSQFTIGIHLLSHLIIDIKTVTHVKFDKPLKIEIQVEKKVRWVVERTIYNTVTSNYQVDKEESNRGCVKSLRGLYFSIEIPIPLREACSSLKNDGIIEIK